MIKSKAYRIIMAALLVLWCVLIFALSAEPANKSSNTSGELTRAVFSIFYPDFNEMGAEAQNAIISEASFIIRKTAHLSLYLILGVLSFLNIAAYNIPFALKPVLSLGFSSAYSISDEIHQRFVPGRSCELRDVLIDISGAIIGIALIFIIFSIKKGGRNMRKKELLKLNEQLFEKAENAIRAAEELKRENSSLLSKIEELEKKLSGVKEAPKPSAPLQTIEKKMVSEVKLKNETEYGASVIGKIVLSSTSHCNELTLTMGSAAKELINLILGRTEVAKAEILKITSSDAPLEDKKAMIDSELISAEDYFKSVMAQK